MPRDPVSPRAPQSYAPPVERPLRIAESRDPLDFTVTHDEREVVVEEEPEVWGDTPTTPVAEAPPVPTFPDSRDALIDALAKERDALRCEVKSLRFDREGLAIVTVVLGVALIAFLIFNRR